jgi:hypothetical protein
MEEARETKRNNALIPLQQNREEVQKYEQALMQMNRNRSNIQQRPYENDYDYYNRLKEALRCETQRDCACAERAETPAGAAVPVEGRSHRAGPGPRTGGI